LGFICLGFKWLILRSEYRDDHFSVEDRPSNEEMVTMVTFGNMLVWFGPFVDHNKRVVLLDTICDIVTQPYVINSFYFLFILVL
jgi:hypothetical protein